MLSAYHWGRDAVMAAANMVRTVLLPSRSSGRPGNTPGRPLRIVSGLPRHQRAARLAHPRADVFAAPRRSAPRRALGRMAGVRVPGPCGVLPHGKSPTSADVLCPCKLSVRPAAEARALPARPFLAGLLLGVAMQTQFNAIPLGLPLALVTVPAGYKKAWETPGRSRARGACLRPSPFRRRASSLGMILRIPTFSSTLGLRAGHHRQIHHVLQALRTRMVVRTAHPGRDSFLSSSPGFPPRWRSRPSAAPRRWAFLRPLAPAARAGRVSGGLLSVHGERDRGFPAIFSDPAARAAAVLPRTRSTALWELFSRLSPWARRTARLLLAAVFIGPGAWEGAVNGHYFSLEDSA